MGSWLLTLESLHDNVDNASLWAQTLSENATSEQYLEINYSGKSTFLFLFFFSSFYMHMIHESSHDIPLILDAWDSFACCQQHGCDVLAFLFFSVYIYKHLHLLRNVFLFWLVLAARTHCFTWEWFGHWLPATNNHFESSPEGLVPT